MSKATGCRGLKSGTPLFSCSFAWRRSAHAASAEMLFLCSNKTSLISSTPFSTTSFKRYVVQEPNGRLSLGIVLLLTDSFQPQLEGDNRPSDSQAHREQVLAAARVKAMNEPANLRKRMDEKVRHAFMSARRNVTTPMCMPTNSVSDHHCTSDDTIFLGPDEP